MITTVFKWLGTALTVLGAAATSLGLDPLNVYLLNAGALTWLVAAVRMREASLIAVNGLLLLIYVVGTILRQL
jgi:hypothetical protein